MRFVVILEGCGGELDREESDREGHWDSMIAAIAYRAKLCHGDTIKIIDTQEEE